MCWPSIKISYYHFIKPNFSHEQKEKYKKVQIVINPYVNFSYINPDKYLKLIKHI